MGLEVFIGPSVAHESMVRKAPLPPRSSEVGLVPLI